MVEKSPIVNVLVTSVLYSLLEISSIFTVSLFLTYPVLPVITPLIYSAHLLARARLYVPVESPAIVPVLDLYVLSSLALVILVNEKLVGVYDSPL